ncbi:MAG: hypothetical protein U0R64_01520 [Candidatus Nanopelagicales bacterium]
MIKKIGTIVATIVMFGALAGPAMAAPEAHTTHHAAATTGLVGVSEHDNVLDIESSESLSFTWDGGYSITAGQPWGGVTTGSGTPGGGSGINVTADAGRSGSSEVADWFNARSTLAVGDDQGTDNSPEELNFAFSGTLSINGTDYPVVIGQGHSGANNNWWIGGQGTGWTASADGQTVASSVLYLITPDGEYGIGSEYGMTNQFGVAPAGDL